MTKQETIDRARSLRRDDQLEESQALLLDLLADYPDDPVVLFEVGGAYDVLGEARTAIDYYQQAREQGLEEAELEECLICLGINHRAIGDFEDAVEVLEEAARRYPDSRSVQAFLALAYYSDGQEDEAVRLLLSLLVETSSDAGIQAYADTLDYYRDNLDTIWDD